MGDIKALVKNQKEYFYTGSTLSVEVRKEALKKLKNEISGLEKLITRVALLSPVQEIYK